MGASLGRRCPTSGCGLGQVRPRWKLSSSVGRGRPTWGRYGLGHGCPSWWGGGALVDMVWGRGALDGS